MKHKHISRVVTGRTNGWQVRLMRNGIKHSKFFSIKRFGGIEEALTVAINYRDSLLSIAPPSAQARSTFLQMQVCDLKQLGHTKPG